MERIWHNCQSFNEPDSDICATACEAQQAFHARWQQQGLPQHEVRFEKQKSGRSGKQAAAGAEGKDAGKGLKKKAGAKTETAAAGVSGKAKKAEDDRGHTAKQDLPQSTKRKHGRESVANSDAVGASAKQPEGKSKGGTNQQQHIAPEKMSASARLRKGLPPTPSLRISPRGAAAEAVDEAPASEAGQSVVADVAVKGKAKGGASDRKTDSGQVKSEAGHTVPRRTSGRLK